MRIKIENARISFASGLFTASTIKGGLGTPKFGAHFLVYPDSRVYNIDGDKPVLTTLPKVEMEVAVLVFGKRASAILPTLAEGRQRSIRRGDLFTQLDGSVSPGYEGVQYVAAKSTTPVKVFDQDPQKELTLQDGKPRSGDRVDVIISMYGHADASKRGIFCSLEGVQYRARGPSLGGAASATASEFGVIASDAPTPQAQSAWGNISGDDVPM